MNDIFGEIAGMDTYLSSMNGVNTGTIIPLNIKSVFILAKFVYYTKYEIKHQITTPNGLPI